jgi:hypothetical protein
MVVASDNPAQVQPSPDYEGAGCAAFASSAVRSCQVFAEQTCYDPNLPDAVTLAIQSTRLQQLGDSEFQVHATSYCRRRYCDDGINAPCDNPSNPAERERCIPCLEACNSACLMNVELQCLKKVCASTIGAASESVLAADVVVEHRELLHRWLKTLLTVSRDSTGSLTPGVCSDRTLEASDTAVIGEGGLTYTKALISCVNNYYSADKISNTISNANRNVQDDRSCVLVDKCPRNNVALAKDRAAKMWRDLAARYSGF